MQTGHLILASLGTYLGYKTPDYADQLWPRQVYHDPDTDGLRRTAYAAIGAALGSITSIGLESLRARSIAVIRLARTREWKLPSQTPAPLWMLPVIAVALYATSRAGIHLRKVYKLAKAKAAYEKKMGKRPKRRPRKDSLVVPSD